MSKAMGNNIRRLRKSVGLKQWELSIRMDVTAQTISSWEVGRTEPNMGQIEMLCRIFNCDMPELLRGTQNHVLPDDRELVDAYHDASDSVKAAIRTLLGL